MNCLGGACAKTYDPVVSKRAVVVGGKRYVVHGPILGREYFSSMKTMTCFPSACVYGTETFRGDSLKNFAVLFAAAIALSCTSKNPQTGAQSSALSSSPPPASYIPRVGVAVSTGSRTCLAIQNGNLSSGSPVTLVNPTLPQSFTQAEIGAASQSPCPIRKDVNPALSSYDVQVTGASLPKLTPLIAVLGTSAAFSQQNNNVQADLDQNGKAELFRACSANDGVHLTVWSSAPTTGTVIWHGFYYEPSNAAAGPPCTAKETAGP